MEQQKIETGYRKITDLSSYTFGKVPPQARELEEAILGAMMLESNAVQPVLSIIRNADVFYLNAHKLVFQAIINLFAKNSVVDILTVTEELKKMQKLEDVGGAFFVTQLTARIASAANVEHHARIVLEKWVQREKIRISSEIIRNAYDDSDDVLDSLGDSIDNLSTLLNSVINGGHKTFSTSVDDVFARIASNLSLPAEQRAETGYLTGIPELDKIVHFKKSQFIVLSGRPGHGKTSMEIQCMLHNAKAGIPVGCFSLEMAQDELVAKLIAMESGVSIDNINSGELDEFQQERISNARDIIRELPIYIYDSGDESGVSMNDISSIAKAWKARYKVEMIFVDYLQLIKTDGENSKYSNRERDVSGISRSLKRLANKLKCPVVGVSALSRNLENRAGWGKRPTDADLRESGSIEFDANVIIHIFRPEKVGLETYADDGVYNDNTSTFDTVELHVSKHRGSSRLGRIRQHVDNGTSVLSMYKSQSRYAYESKAKGKVQKNYYEPEKDDDTPF